MRDITRVVIVEKTRDMRNYFRQALKNESDIDIVGIAPNEEDGLAIILREKPDVVLLDIKIDTPLAGINIIRKVLSEPEFINTKFVVATDTDNREALISAYSAGATDFLSKHCSITDVICAIKGTQQQTVRLSLEIGRALIDEIEALRNTQESLLAAVNYVIKLTHTEVAILKALVDGESYRSIAEKRFVSETTIRIQASNVVKKCKRKNVKDLVAWMRDLKFLSNIDI